MCDKYGWWFRDNRYNMSVSEIFDSFFDVEKQNFMVKFPKCCRQLLQNFEYGSLSSHYAVKNIVMSQHSEHKIKVDASLDFFRRLEKCATLRKVAIAQNIIWKNSKQCVASRKPRDMSTRKNGVRYAILPTYRNMLHRQKRHDSRSDIVNKVRRAPKMPILAVSLVPLATSLWSWQRAAAYLAPFRPKSPFFLLSIAGDVCRLIYSLVW